MDKQCKKCGETKSLCEFYTHKNMRDGHLSACKMCVNAQGRAKYASWTPEEKESNRQRSQRWRHENADRHNETNRAAVRRRPEQYARTARTLHYKRRFGMTIDDYETMLADQGDACAICGSTEAKGYGKHFPIDHDHVTGEIRGLLCSKCNAGLGLFNDDPARLTAAVAYLTERTTRRLSVVETL